MDETFLIGIILNSNNVQVWDTVKEAFVLALKRQETRFDLVYFYQTGVMDVGDRLAKGLSRLVTAKPEKIRFTDALRTTLDVVNSQTTHDFQRWLFVITDNYTSKSELISSLILSKQDISYVFFGLGEKYDKTSLEKLGMVCHADNPNLLKEEIIKFIDKMVEERKNGRYV